MIKYMVLFPHTFSTQFNFVELDYLSVSYKKNDTFNEIFPTQPFVIFQWADY